nr:mannose-6-phosphate isomerase [Quercus suber]
MQVPLLRLQCGCNSYEWGKVGKDSAAARFASATSFTIQEDKPYAEVRPSASSSISRMRLYSPSLAMDGNPPLKPLQGPHHRPNPPRSCTRQSSAHVAHPNKKLAEQLHAKDSKNYPDDNHKPEMTIAVTPFDGLCGFRPLAETAHFLQTVPSLRELVGEEAAKKFVDAVKGKEESVDKSQMQENKKALQAAFTALMDSKPEEVQKAAEKLIQQAKDEGSQFAGEGGPSNDGQELADLMVRLNGQFPGDIGLFVTFFLNYVKLEVGEAMFLKADDIHAYLSGDIIECMAASDNVVRAGFTPKFKDVPTLTTMLTYNYAPISEQKMDPVDYPYCKLNTTSYNSSSAAILYDPPIEEFSVVKTDLNQSGAKVTFEPIEGPSIVICTKGKGKISVGPKTEEIQEGWVYFVGATAELVLESTGSAPLVTFKAFCELSGKEDAKM